MLSSCGFASIYCLRCKRSTGGEGEITMGRLPVLLLICGAPLASASLSANCDAFIADSLPLIPANFNDPTKAIRPASLMDDNTDASIVEVNIWARPVSWDFGFGTLSEIWAYNDVLPGPTIEANVGDTLIVNFCNDLPEPTTIHWHGVETPSTMDGSNIAQLAVPANGGTFRYEFPLLRAGMFWYHPHIQTHVQVEKGLYGVLLVHDPVEDAALGLPQSRPGDLSNREHIFVLDDIWLDGSFQVREPFLGTKEDVAMEQLNGREGPNTLFNGLASFGSGSLLDIFMELEVVHRLRMINVANSRFMRMSFRNHSLWRIGGDQGLIEEAYEILPAVPLFLPPPPSSTLEFDPHLADPDPTTGVLMTPGERGRCALPPDRSHVGHRVGSGMARYATGETQRRVPPRR